MFSELQKSKHVLSTQCYVIQPSVSFGYWSVSHLQVTIVGKPKMATIFGFWTKYQLFMGKKKGVLFSRSLLDLFYFQKNIWGYSGHFFAAPQVFRPKQYFFSRNVPKSPTPGFGAFLVKFKFKYLNEFV